ncbi:hypothetical protein HPB48_001731 [Haemaphysalis longicornis]|uniref:Organic cation/carnitine transporter n=1 Tax=Haemaphysalis longicornis TaxID=44386 RepID=A0A9J6FNQ0_HAELO|nr:hypothetical protein HPB48_001731 [Haemaphysalis longicornis]
MAIQQKTTTISFMDGIFPLDFCIADVEASDGFDCEEAFGHGKFQMGLLLFATLSLWVSQSHTLAFPLISTDVDHWCRQPADLNVSADEWKTMAIPLEADGRRSRCTVLANASDPNDTAVVECDAWDYDPKGVRSTVVSAWNLVCQRSWLKALANAIYITSGLAFLAVAAYSADHFGRLPAVLASGTIVVLASLLGSFAMSYAYYVCTRFLVAGCDITLYVLSGVLLAESCGCAYRAVYLTFSAMAGHILSETVFISLSQMRNLNWVSLQLLMIAPTMVLPRRPRRCLRVPPLAGI